MKDSHPTPPSYTLEEILEEREKVLQKIRRSKSDMKRQLQNMFAPPPSSSRLEETINWFQRGIAIYDGVLTGARIIYRLRNMIRR